MFRHISTLLVKYFTEYDSFLVYGDFNNSRFDNESIKTFCYSYSFCKTEKTADLLTFTEKSLSKKFIM